MKKFVLLCVMMMTCVFATEKALANYLPVKKVRTTLRISEYHGTIGKNRVTFTVGTSTMGVEGYSYMYDNVGEWIELHPSGRSGRYQIFKEYVNGRCTGTFKIIWGANTITGTFRNYKGQTFKVYARSV